jgi:hypothetical protein
MEEFSLRHTDLDSPRNGFLLANKIEEYFDKKWLCFLYNPFTRLIQLKVLHPGNLTEVVAPGHSLTFNDIDGRPLLFPDEVEGEAFGGPFRRILSFHAMCSIRFAEACGWPVPATDAQTSYFALSDNASVPKL